MAPGPELVRSRRSAVLEWASTNPLLVLGAIMVLTIMVVALFAPLIARYPADAGTASHPFELLQPPSSSHPFGTDQLGRDIFTRVLYAARISPSIGLIVVAFSFLLGVPLGLVAGYFGGVVDEVLMRITDVFLAVPPLLLALAFAAVLPKGMMSTIMAITIAWWPWYARLARGEAASVTNRPYIENCRVLGLARWRILVRHVLPSSFTPVLVQASLDLGGVILTAAALSFLGLGLQNPTPDWGLMVSEGQRFYTTDWWVMTFPGLAILFTCVAANLLGDGLRDFLDPRRVFSR